MNRIDFRLILITDRKFLNSVPLDKFVERCCRYGIKAVQLREKDLSSKELLLLSIKLRKATEKYSAKLLVNDRLDIALLSGADGVHSPENGILPYHIKKIDKNLIAGRSVHSLRSALKAVKDGYDYIICGPIFRTNSKIKFGKPLGLPGLKKICQKVNIPVFAIGGINPARAKKCIKNGAQGICVISRIFKSNNLKKTINDYNKAIEY